MKKLSTKTFRPHQALQFWCKIYFDPRSYQKSYEFLCVRAFVVAGHTITRL